MSRSAVPDRKDTAGWHCPKVCESLVSGRDEGDPRRHEMCLESCKIASDSPELRLTALGASASAPWLRIPVIPKLCTSDAVQVAQRWQLEPCCRFFTLASSEPRASGARVCMHRSDCLILGKQSFYGDLKDLHIEGVSWLLSHQAVHVSSPSPPYDNQGMDCLWQLSCVNAGGVVVVMGTDSNVQLKRITFSNCCMVVLGGASVTVHSSCFHAEGDDSTGLCMYVSGAGSSVTMHNCSIGSTCHGAFVTEGASLHGDQLQCVGTNWVALHATGAGTVLSVSNSTLRDRAAMYSEEAASEWRTLRPPAEKSTGIIATSSCILHISDTAITGFCVGCAARGAHTHMLRTSLEWCLERGCHIDSCPTSDFQRCTFNHTQNRSSLLVSWQCGSNTQGSASVTGCAFHDNLAYGISAESVLMQVSDCDFHRNRKDVGVVRGSETLIRLRDCRSQGSSRWIHATGAGTRLEVERAVVVACKKGIALLDHAKVQVLDSSISLEGTVLAHIARSAKVCLRNCGMVGSPSESMAVFVDQAAQLRAADCVFKNAVLCVHGRGSSAALQRCSLRSAGAADDMPVLQAAYCGHLALADCSVRGCKTGVHVGDAGTVLEARGTLFECMVESGVSAWEGARMELHDCWVRDCGCCAVGACNAGTQVLMTGGGIQECGGGGLVCTDAVVEASHVHVSNVDSAFAVEGRGCMYLSECSSEGCTPYSVADGGRLFCHACSPDDKSLPCQPVPEEP